MLSKLQSADTLEKFADAIGYRAAGLSYVLFKPPAGSRYRTFEIPKATGGVRTIHAPDEKLKALQARLAAVLAECNAEIHAKHPRRPLSHGFEPGRSIFTNAWEHKKRRYVLNFDIEDFFPTINFGRIQGFFNKNRAYALPTKAATLIAQIACFNGRLPQGSPCSPVIANLIAHLLDTQMVRLAKENKCTYSRYADDLTFSTNQKQFPVAIAEELPGFPGSWVLSGALLGAVRRSGFSVNHAKTRMHCRPNQQLVTGLTVNEKVNIQAAYYRKARKMCSSLFNHGQYYNSETRYLGPQPVTGEPLRAIPKMIDTFATLEGILSHIYYIKNSHLMRSEPDAVARKAKDNKERYPAYRSLYKKFLYFRHFVSPTAPLIMCEGKTDNIYMRSALKALASSYPKLAEVRGGILYSKIRFLKHSRTEHDILELSGGCSKIAAFISHYQGGVLKYKHRPLKYPVIILVDNDSGPSKGGVFSNAGKLSKSSINFLSSAPFYHICHNLYLIKTPEEPPTGESNMEMMFDPSVLATVIDGKIFNSSDKIDDAKEYGKIVFADKVIRPNYATINFSKYAILLDRIQAVMTHFAANKPSAAT